MREWTSPPRKIFPNSSYIIHSSNKKHWNKCYLHVLKFLTTPFGLITQFPIKIWSMLTLASCCLVPIIRNSMNGIVTLRFLLWSGNSRDIMCYSEPNQTNQLVPEEKLQRDHRGETGCQHAKLNSTVASFLVWSHLTNADHAMTCSTSQKHWSLCPLLF